MSSCYEVDYVLLRVIKTRKIVLFMLFNPLANTALGTAHNTTAAKGSRASVLSGATMAAPPVSWLKGATNIASRATAPVDAAFFQHFDQLGVESQQLSGAEGNLNQAKQRFGECTARLKAHKDALAKNEAYAKEQRDRIQLVSKHWFYGTTALQPQLWMRGGTDGKISRAKTKLEKCERDHPGLVAQVAQVEQQELPPLQAAVSATQGAFQRKQDCEAERNNMRVAAVNANKTATLVQLQGQEAACGQAAEACQAQLQQLGSIAALCRVRRVEARTQGQTSRPV